MKSTTRIYDDYTAGVGGIRTEVPIWKQWLWWSKSFGRIVRFLKICESECIVVLVGVARRGRQSDFEAKNTIYRTPARPNKWAWQRPKILLFRKFIPPNLRGNNIHRHGLSHQRSSFLAIHEFDFNYPIFRFSNPLCVLPDLDRKCWLSKRSHLFGSLRFLFHSRFQSHMAMTGIGIKE